MLLAQMWAPAIPVSTITYSQKKKTRMSTQIEDLVYQAKLAEQAERYEEMVEAMKKNCNHKRTRFNC